MRNGYGTPLLSPSSSDHLCPVFLPYRHRKAETEIQKEFHSQMEYRRTVSFSYPTNADLPVMNGYLKQTERFSSQSPPLYSSVFSFAWLVEYFSRPFLLSENISSKFQDKYTVNIRVPRPLKTSSLITTFSLDVPALLSSPPGQ